MIFAGGFKLSEATKILSEKRLESVCVDKFTTAPVNRKLE